MKIVPYQNESQLVQMTQLIEKDLSEPYSIYTYRYFLHEYPHLSFLVKKFVGNFAYDDLDDQDCIGVIICKLDSHKGRNRGYIGMLAVSKEHRKKGIGSKLVQRVIGAIRSDPSGKVHEIVLDTEVTNQGALALYERLGFIRDKRLCQYYLNGVDAYRLKLWIRPPPEQEE